MTEDGMAIGFAVVVCTFALYKLLYGVDSRPARRPRREPSGAATSPPVRPPAAAKDADDAIDDATPACDP